MKMTKFLQYLKSFHHLLSYLAPIYSAKCTGVHSNHNRQKKLNETPKIHESYQISRIFQISRQISITKIFGSIRVQIRKVKYIRKNLA